MPQTHPVTPQDTYLFCRPTQIYVPFSAAYKINNTPSYKSQFWAFINFSAMAQNKVLGDRLITVSATFTVTASSLEYPFEGSYITLVSRASIAFFSSG